MTPEAIDFAKSTLSTGGQPTKVRNLLLEKFCSHLISKDLINLKQTLTDEQVGMLTSGKMSFTIFAVFKMMKITLSKFCRMLMKKWQLYLSIYINSADSTRNMEQ